MRNVCFVIFAGATALLCTAINLLYTCRMQPYSRLLKLEDQTAMYIHNGTPQFYVKSLQDSIRICELGNKQVLHNTSVYITNFTHKISFDVAQDFASHIADF